MAKKPSFFERHCTLIQANLPIVLLKVPASLSLATWDPVHRKEKYADQGQGSIDGVLLISDSMKMGHQHLFKW